MKSKLLPLPGRGGVVAQVPERGSGCVPIRGFGPDPGVTRIRRVTARGDRWAALRRLGDRYQATEAAADLAALTFRIRAEHRDRVLDIGTIAEASRLPALRHVGAAIWTPHAARRLGLTCPHVPSRALTCPHVPVLGCHLLDDLPSLIKP